MNFNELSDLMKRNRSYRRFDASRKISDHELDQLVNVARYCPSGRNMQPLKYRKVFSQRELDQVFPLLKWAGYLTDWDGPAPEERPTAYLVQCLDTTLSQNCLCDDGLQLEALTLAAVSCGLGCCIIKSFDIPALLAALGIPEHLKPLYVLAIGHPVEQVAIEDIRDNDIHYYRDADAVHHVPKRPLPELLIQS